VLFTKEEKIILITILAAAITGIIINVFTSYGQGLQKRPEVKTSPLININLATAEELEALPGVGKVTALRIIKYRESHGALKSVEELKNVKGITQKKFDRLKQYIEAP
jgi:competence protein ComEA